MSLFVSLYCRQQEETLCENEAVFAQVRYGDAVGAIKDSAEAETSGTVKQEEQGEACVEF